MTKQDWPLTPAELRFKAQRLGPDGWSLCEYTDLKAGDIFRALDPDGEPIHPLTYEPDADTVGFCHNEAIKATERGQGFQIEITTGTVEELKKEFAN